MSRGKTASLHRIATMGCALTGALLTTTILGASPAAATGLTCAQLTGVSVPVTNGATTVINSATDTAAANGTPEYCNVLATTGTNTSIQIQLPLPANFRNRYLHVGGSGFDGGLPPATPAAYNVNLLAEGIVVGESNGGHTSGNPGDYSFAGNQSEVLGYAWTAIEYTDVVARALMTAYYGSTAKYRYFDGCSNGGKNASVAAGKFGSTYDGVIGGDGLWGRSAENVEGSDTAAMAATWARVVAVTTPLPNYGTTLVPKLTAFYNNEVAACDGLDGVLDGIISNPSACNYHPAEMACATGVDTPACFTPAELAAVKTIRSDLLYNGRVIGAPYGLGNMAYFGIVPTAIFGGGADLGTGFMALAYNNAAYSLTSFNLNKDYKFLVDQLENTDYMNGSTADVAKFLEKGGKLMVWHGGEDQLIPTKTSTRFVARLLEMTNSQGQSNVRYYTPPGVNHCLGGPGADSFDMVTPMMEWVEHGKAPKTLLAAQVSMGGTVNFTRPLCIHPQYPKYINGNVNEASSFVCTNP